MSLHKAESVVKQQGRIERLVTDLHDRGYEQDLQAIVYLKGERIVDIGVGACFIVVQSGGGAGHSVSRLLTTERSDER